MQFLRPEAFFLLIPLLILLLALFWKQKRAGAWSHIVAKHLMPYLLVGEAHLRLIPGILTALLGTLLITALAGPTWQKTAVPIVQGQSGLVIALDLSYAMDAADLKPSRLQRAVYKINDILDKRKEGQTALIVYSEEAFVVTPLTDDTKTIKALLPVLETSIMPVNGLRHDKAIFKGAELLKQAGITEGSILLITAEYPSKTPSIHSDIPISILGVGTDEGAPIPKKDGGFVLDEKGAVVITKLNREKLSSLASLTGGRYATIRSDDKDLAELFGQAKYEARKEEGLTHMKWHDGGYWVVLLALPFAAFLLRRGALAFVFILFVLPVQGGFWKTPNQKGYEQFEQENYEKAAKTFTDANWKAASYYKSKQYEEAEALYQQDQTADGYYNLGNALAQQGKYEEALKAYDKALEEDPDHEDALHNKKVIEELKNQQNQQDKGKGQGQNDKNDQSKDQSDQNDQNDKNDQNDQDDQKEQNQNKDQQGDEESDSQNEKEDQQDKEKEEQQYRDQVDEELQNQEPQEMAASDENEMDPQRQIDDRWLQKIPDDPGGLLRRKFLYQYRKQKGRS